MNRSVSLEYLPSEILEAVFQWLDLKDIISLSLISKRLNQATLSNIVWKRFCKNYWLNETLCFEQESWIDHFKHIYKEWGRYSDCFAKIKTIWNSLEEYFKTNCPMILDSLNDGTTEKELNDLERIQNVTLPNCIRCFYRMHNGQKRDTQIGFFSYSSFHHLIYSLLFLDIIQAVQLGYAKNILVLGYCGDNESLLACCLKQLEGGLPRETIFNYGGSCSAFFIKAPSFLSFMQEYANNIVTNKLTLENNILYSFYRNPEWKATTHGITVTVGVLFRPDLSSLDPLSFIFSYHINMSMDKYMQTSNSYQLKSRHWKIQTGENEEYVEGRGVVGEYPIMYPGASFSWMSYTSISMKDTLTTMSGFFRMKNRNKDEVIEVQCPAFSFLHPPFYEPARTDGFFF